MAFASLLRGGGEGCQPPNNTGLNCSSHPSSYPQLQCPTTIHSRSTHQTSRPSPWWRSWTKKYVILCCVCGGTSILLGVIFIVIYFTLHYYTSSLQYFETVPTYAPAVVLVITGLLVTCFARRRNRYTYLIKLAGGCCLMCALLCVVITVTTTVIHMNRLQTLRECVYTQKSKTCTCFAGIGDDEGAARYVFNNTPDCEVVHGSLYTCLRAMFGLSVIGILVCIFSSMLVYQLLSHEKKKMYWEQLEMRRRFFYRQPSHPLYCNCYDDYGFTAPAPHDLYHWQPWEVNSDRCWPTRSMTPRMGFGADDGGSILVGSSGHRASGWNWLPWSRSRPEQQQQQQQQPQISTSSIPSGNSVAPVPNGNIQCLEGQRLQAGCLPESPRNQSFSSHHHAYWSVDGSRTGPRRNHHGRRRRSNDAVFHHLNMTPPTRYQPPFISDTNYGTSISYAAYTSLSHHLWGPPPPYSRPPSAENVATNLTPCHSSQRSRSLAGSGFVSLTDPISNEACGRRSTGVERPTDLRATVGDKLPEPIVQRQQQQCPQFVSNLFWDDNEKGSLPNRYDALKEQMCISCCINKVHGSSTVPSLGTRRSMVELPYSKSTPQIPQNCVCLPFTDKYEECNLVAVTVDRCARRGSGSYTPQERMSERTVSIDTPSSATDRTSSSTDSFEGDDVSIFRTSMIVSTTPSTPVKDVSHLVDVAFARSLPNLNLTIGSGGGGSTGSGQEDQKTTDNKIDNVVPNDNVPNLNDKPLVTIPFEHSKLHCLGLSDSSPVLPLSVPSFFRMSNSERTNKYLPEVDIFSGQSVSYLESFKSKSLGHLSPKDNIVLTYKSIHV